MEVIGSNTNVGVNHIIALLSPKKSITADDRDQSVLDDSNAEHRHTLSQLSPSSGFQNEDGEIHAFLNNLQIL
jgi:hypothetical protein